MTVTSAPSTGLAPSSTLPLRVPQATPQPASLNEPMKVAQFQAPVSLTYSWVYQKVQSSTGSTSMEL